MVLSVSSRVAHLDSLVHSTRQLRVRSRFQLSRSSNSETLTPRRAIRRRAEPEQRHVRERATANAKMGPRINGPRVISVIPPEQAAVATCRWPGERATCRAIGPSEQDAEGASGHRDRRKRRALHLDVHDRRPPLRGDEEPWVRPDHVAVDLALEGPMVVWNSTRSPRTGRGTDHRFWGVTTTRVACMPAGAGWP
jgi:hypothetical protein